VVVPKVGKIVRAAVRALSPPSSPAPNPRASSLPFVSGDTFRSVAEVIIEKGHILVQDGMATGVIFSDGQSALSPDFIDILTLVKNQLSSKAVPSLVIHNSDTVPTLEAFRSIRKIIPRVFSSNVLESAEGVTALPLGLENVALKRNGKLHYYFDAIQNPVPPEQRPLRVLSSFHESTNRAIREPVRDLMRASRHGHQEEFAKSLDYRLRVRGTKFVISPPGGGMDCHRTWESLYLGAVPVVLDDYLATSLTADLPILAVRSYEDFLELDDNQLDELYVQLREKPLTNAWGWTWLSRVLGS